MKLINEKMKGARLAISKDKVVEVDAHGVLEVSDEVAEILVNEGWTAFKEPAATAKKSESKIDAAKSDDEKKQRRFQRGE